MYNLHGPNVRHVTADVLILKPSKGFDARYGDSRNKLHPESCSPLQLNKKIIGKIICKLGLFRNNMQIRFIPCLIFHNYKSEKSGGWVGIVGVVVI